MYCFGLYFVSPTFSTPAFLVLLIPVLQFQRPPRQTQLCPSQPHCGLHPAMFSLNDSLSETYQYRLHHRATGAKETANIINHFICHNMLTVDIIRHKGHLDPSVWFRDTPWNVYTFTIHSRRRGLDTLALQESASVFKDPEIQVSSQLHWKTIYWQRWITITCGRRRREPGLVSQQALWTGWIEQKI